MFSFFFLCYPKTYFFSKYNPLNAGWEHFNLSSLVLSILDRCHFRWCPISNCCRGIAGMTLNLCPRVWHVILNEYNFVFVLNNVSHCLSISATRVNIMYIYCKRAMQVVHQYIRWGQIIPIGFQSSFVRIYVILKSCNKSFWVELYELFEKNHFPFLDNHQNFHNIKKM